MVKIGMYMIAFREPNLIKPSIEQWLPFKIDKILIACSEKPWFGGLEKDNTVDLARETGVEVVERYWPTEHEQRNWAMDQFKGFDWVINWFPDQLLTLQGRFNFIKFVQSDPKEFPIYSVGGFTFWKDLHTIVQPSPNIKAVFRPDVRFENTYMVEGEGGEYPVIPGVDLYHLQWSKKKDEILSKSLSYGHAPDFDPNWVENVWERKATHDFHPISPGVFKETKEFHCPQEIIDMLDPEWVKEVDG